jgi:hypothetical protein
MWQDVDGGRLVAATLNFPYFHLRDVFEMQKRGARSSHCLPHDEGAMALLDITAQVMKDALHRQLWRRPGPSGSLHCQFILVLSMFGHCGEVSIVVDVAFRLKVET